MDACRKFSKFFSSPSSDFFTLSFAHFSCLITHFAFFMKQVTTLPMNAHWLSSKSQLSAVQCPWIERIGIQLLRSPFYGKPHTQCALQYWPPFLTSTVSYCSRTSITKVRLCLASERIRDRLRSVIEHVDGSAPAGILVAVLLM